jgi:hypothetical protein
MAVSEKDGVIRFMETGDGSSSMRMGNEGNSEVRATAIDSLNKDIAMIKMDIEGAELSALKGARNTITKDIPILAICIYHSPEDMVEIPEWLMENFPAYRFYVRKHSKGAGETVLYAVKE